MVSAKLHIEYSLLLLTILVNTPCMGSFGLAFDVLIRGSEFGYREECKTMEPGQ